MFLCRHLNCVSIWTSQFFSMCAPKLYFYVDTPILFLCGYANCVSMWTFRSCFYVETANCVSMSVYGHSKKWCHIFAYKRQCNMDFGLVTRWLSKCKNGFYVSIVTPQLCFYVDTPIMFPCGYLNCISIRINVSNKAKPYFAMIKRLGENTSPDIAYHIA